MSRVSCSYIQFRSRGLTEVCHVTPHSLGDDYSVVRILLDTSGTLTRSWYYRWQCHRSFRRGGGKRQSYGDRIGDGAVRAVTTDAQGLYVIPGLRPTTYRLSVEAQGFKRYAQPNIPLLADQSVTVDVKLSLGEATQAVTVQGAVVQVDT